MKKLCSLFAALLFAGSMMAVTITPDNCGWSTTAGEQSGVVEGVTVATNQGVVGTASSVTAMRIYKTKTLTISAASNITKIEFTCTAKGTAQYGPGCFAAQTGYTFEESGNKGTWEGSATSVTFTAESNQVRATQIVVTLDGEGGDTPSTLADGYYLVGNMNSWTPAAAYKLAQNTAAAEGVVEYMLDITFAANAEFKVRQVAEGEATAWFPAEGDNCTINDAGEYTVYFRPNADGGDGWFQGVILNQKHEAPVVEPTTCAAIYNMAKNDAVDLLNDVVVTYVSGKNVYVKDATGAMLLYLPANATWAAGDVLSGVAGTVDIYNGLYELKPSAEQVAAVSAVAGEVPAAVELTALAVADMNKFAHLSNVSVAAGEFSDASITNLDMVLGEETYVLRNNFKLTYTFEADKLYNITGVVSYYVKNDNATLQFFPTAIEEVTEPVAPADGYYLVGNMNSWTPAAAYKFVQNEAAAEGVVEYMLDITFAANAEFKVRQVADGEATAWFPAEGDNCTINDAGEYTVYFRPNADGGDGWFQGVILNQKHEAPVVEPTTCAAIYNMAKNDAVDLLNDVVVTYVAGKNIYVKDATGAMLLYLPANATWAAGDVLSGVAGTVDIYNGLYELKPSAEQVAAVVATAGEAPAAVELTALAVGDINKFAHLSNVAVVEGEFTDASITNLDMVLGEETYVLRNNFKIAYAFEADKLYNITGIVSYYVKNDNATLQFFPTAIEEVTEPEVLEDGYYLVGTMNEWTPAAEYMFELNEEAAEGVVEYMFDITFAAGAQFKVRQVANGEATAWFPAEGDNCTINDAGDYTVYFRPNADGGDGWFQGVILCQKHDSELGITNTATDAKAIKTIENGIIIIEMNGIRYNAFGQIVK